MPDTGYSPGGDFGTGGQPIDMSGGGLDPSAYYALSPGGAFPGDEWAYLQWLSGVSRGTAGANPSFQLPDWMLHASGGKGALSKFVQWNATHGGVGNPPTGFGTGESGGYPYQLYSGPGAAYGPQGGPLSGLIDQGNPNNIDGPSDPAGGSQPAGKGTKPKGHGGGGAAAPNFTFSPYQGIGYKPSFVAWQPIAPGSQGPYPPTEFVSPGGRAVPSNSVAPLAPQTAGPKVNPHPTGKWRGPNKGKPLGKGGKPPAGAPGAGGPGGPGGPGGGSGDPLDLLLHGPGPNNVSDHHDPTFSGFNPNNLDKATPSWVLDPTTGINNTAGFPGATIPAPKEGQSWDDYYSALHDAGFNMDTIGSLLGPYGFEQTGGAGRGGNPSEQGPPSWKWGWGTGPVVGDPGGGGYHFANQGGPGGGAGAPGGGWGASGGGHPDMSGGSSGYYNRLAY